MEKTKTILCQECEHDEHEPGKCEVLHIYARGPNDPPGNQGCLCGVDLGSITVVNNDNEGWVSSECEKEKEKELTLQQKLAQVAHDTCVAHKGARGCCYVVNLAVKTAIEEYTE